MSNPNYEKLQGNGPAMQEPPPYSEKQPHEGFDSSQPPAGPFPHMGGMGATSPIPPPYQDFHDPPGPGMNQGPVLQPPQPVLVIPAHPTNEPDYLAYSIFTMICCCLPIGVASLVYSIQTREANQAGNLVGAQRNSRMARILAHTALGVGITCTILYIILIVIVSVAQ